MRVWVLAMILAAAATLAAEPDHSATLVMVLQRAGEQVERYFARAQSIVCLEVVHLQPLTPSWSNQGQARTRNVTLARSVQAPDG